MAYDSYFRERYNEFVELFTMVHAQRLAYEQTGNENVLRVLRILEVKLQDARETEAYLNKRDFDEILNHPGLYPEAVVTWAYYETRENREIS